MSAGTADRHAFASDAVVAGLIAAAVSGVPSTVHALLTRADALEAACATGSLLLPSETRPSRLLLAAVPVHLAISLGWAAVLTGTIPRRGGAAWGALAGLAIAALDLGLVGRRLPRIRALPLWPQVADHVAFGAAAGRVLARRSRD